MKYVVLRSFVDKFDAYQKEEQEIITVALDKIKGYIETNQAPYGLRIKRLSQRIYEARINIHHKKMPKEFKALKSCLKPCQ